MAIFQAALRLEITKVQSFFSALHYLSRSCKTALIFKVIHIIKIEAHTTQSNYEIIPPHRTFHYDNYRHECDRAYAVS